MLNSYSDNVKSVICGALFTGAVMGSLAYHSYARREVSRIYEMVNGAISALDGRPATTSLSDWNILYQKVFGRELNLGERPGDSGLAELMKIEAELPKILEGIRLTQIK